MKIKRFTAGMISGVLMASFALTGCGQKAVDPEAVVATLNGKEIKCGLANFMAQYNAVTYDAYYSSYFGADMWSQDFYGNGTTLEETVKQQVMDTLETDYLLEEHMADYDVEITEEELQAMKDAAARFMEDNTEDAVKRMTATEEIVTEMLRLKMVQEKMYDAIIAEADTEVSDEEAAQRTFSYYTITLPEETDSEDAAEAAGTETAEETQSTEEAEEELKAYAQQVAEAAAEDFDGAADTYGLTVSQYSYGSDEETFDADVIAMADELTEGQISDLIETESGSYYVIRLDSEFDEEATESKKQEIISTRQSEYYTEVCEGYKESAEWTIDEKVWANVTFAGNTYTIAVSESDTESAAEAVTEESTQAETGTETVEATESATETE